MYQLKEFTKFKFIINKGNTFSFLNIHKPSFSFFETLCASWSGQQDCEGIVTSSPLPAGDYLLRVDDANTPSGICWIPFTVDNFSDDNSNCEEAIVHANNEIITHSEYGHNSIISHGLVKSDAYIEFAARNDIQLMENFEVEMGAVFHAYIDYEACEK